MQILIKNVTVLTLNAQMDVYENGYLIFEKDTIRKVGPWSELAEQEMNRFDEIIDGDGGILLPGMVNTHTHSGMIPFRSLGDDCRDRLYKLLFPLEIRCMNQELAYSSAKYAIAEMLLGGVTAFADMYYFEEDIARACAEMKIRALLGETVVDFPTCDSEQPFGGLKYGENFLRNWHKHPLITPMIAPHAPYSMNEASLSRAREMSEHFQLPYSIHLSEMDFELAHFREKYGLSPVEYLERIGFLGEKMIAAHCIHVSEHDIELLSRYRVKIAHCIGANTKSGKGVAPVHEMLLAKLDVGLGSDGPSSGNTLDIFSQLKLFAGFHKTVNHDRLLFPAEEIVWLATMGGAKVLQMADRIGSLEPGKKADMILVETQSVNMFPIYNPYSALVYSANASNVDSVFVNGTPLVRNKSLQLCSLKHLREELDFKMINFRNVAREINS